MEINIQELNQKVREESLAIKRVIDEVQKVIVGQTPIIERLLIGILCRGHVLVEGVPGLAKTLAIKTLANCIEAKFSRIQFTPDLLPADLTGTLIYDPKDSTFKAKKGPLFANIVLADEINRAPAKVQSALLEAMQEKQITIGDTTFKLPEPYLVMATQNPIEQEGTYPLPEAQVDRFMLKTKIVYPTREEERIILDRMTTGRDLAVTTAISPEIIEKARRVVDEIYIDNRVKDYIVSLIHCSRNPRVFNLPIEGYIRYGASPRATIFLTESAKGHAFLRGRGYVTPEDIKAMGMDVLRHRILLTYEAEAEGLTSENIISRIFEAVEVP